MKSLGPIVGAGLCVISLGLFAASPAFALDNSPVDMLALMYHRPNQFVLFDQSVEPMQFRTAHPMQICLKAERSRPSREQELDAGTTLTAPADPVPLAVSHNGVRSIVRPGDCLHLAAATDVQISPARDLQRDSTKVPVSDYRDPDLLGTIHVVR